MKRPAGNRDSIADDGYVLLDQLLDRRTCLAVAEQLSKAAGSAGQRHLIDHAAVQLLLHEPRLIAAVRDIFGEQANPNASGSAAAPAPASVFAFNATLFDKHSEQNWLVAWHQDVTIPVAEKRDVPGWTAWSIKEGVDYVCPVDRVLRAVVALRIHLDDCHAENGPLCVLRGSHVLGHVPQTKVAGMADSFEADIIEGDAGSAVFMKPLLIHASSKATADARRRILHLAFAAIDLPSPLVWHRRCAVG